MDLADMTTRTITIRRSSLRRPWRRLAATALLVGGLVLAIGAPAEAATVKRTWTGSFGSAGSSAIQGRTDGTGTFALHVGGLRAGTSYAIRVLKGTCAAPGSALFAFSSSITGADGRIDRDNGINATHMNQIWSADRSGNGRISLRLGSGSLLRCANLAYPVATRFVFASRGIDIPVIRQNSGSFPYCGVAMYLGAFAQPREPWATMIYAHARSGMFLPLLSAAKVNNGAAMLGKTFRVYTSDSKAYTYVVTRVIRHTLTWSGAFSVGSQQVWLQTSEGPYRTSKKMFVVGRLSSVAGTTYSAAHPKAHPYTCAG